MHKLTAFFVSTGLLVVPSAYAQDTSIDPQATRILRQTSAHLASLEGFRVRAEIIEDDWIDTGQLVESGRTVELAVRRPDRMWIETRSETTHKQYWLDGSTVTLMDIAYGTYAEAASPGGIDATLNLLADGYRVIVPLADLALSDLHGSLMTNVETARYLGVRHVGGKEVHHLAFSRADIDWQLWVTTGPQMLPHKLSITYKDEEGAPRFTALLSDWDTASPLPDTIFEFEPEPGVSRIEFVATGGGRD